MTEPVRGRRRRLVALLLVLVVAIPCAACGGVYVWLDGLLGRPTFGVQPAHILSGEDGTPAFVAFTPAGDHLVACFEHTVSVFHLPDGQRVGRFWITDRKEVERGPFSLSPDGRTLAVRGRLHSLPDGAVTARLPFSPRWWSTDGAFAAGFERTKVPGAEGGIAVAPLGATSATPQLAGHEWVAGCGSPRLLLSRDGARVVRLDSGGTTTQVVVERLGAGEETAIVLGGPSEAVALGFGPGERDVRLIRDDRVLEFVPLDGGAPRTRTVDAVSMGRPYVTAGAFSPDGSVVATGSLAGDVRLWDPQGRRLDDHARGEGNVTCLAFSADGRWLASGHHWNTVRVWRLR